MHACAPMMTSPVSDKHGERERERGATSVIHGPVQCTSEHNEESFRHGMAWHAPSHPYQKELWLVLNDASDVLLHSFCAHILKKLVLNKKNKHNLALCA